MSNNILENVRSDDFVEYFLYPKCELNDEKQVEKLLTNLLKETNKLVENLTQNYIWHKDEFKLIIKTQQTSILDDAGCGNIETIPHLYGITFYGDNIQDEWFIVYLLQEISKNISDFVIRVIDSDGEFLLIEAADFLPSWADPERCDKRVYLHQGLLHLIPLEKGKQGISIREAIHKITHSSNTIASKHIQNAIQNRISGYPQMISDNLHRVNLYLPVGIAAILKSHPNLIAPAVLAFCNRDVIDMKACRAMKYFPPENRVYTSVTFTKFLYAMLVHSKYSPDRKTGWNLPHVNDPNYKAHYLGIRIACGFEILANQSKSSGDIDNDNVWCKYLSNLKNKNYFKGLLENSKDYNELLNKAKDYYLNHQDSMQTTTVAGGFILNLLKSLDYDIEELQSDAMNLPPNDDESWLDISSEELDKMLQERYGQRDFMAVNENTNASNFTEKVNRFLNEMSCVEGVEFPKDDGVQNERNTKSKVSFAADTKEEDGKESNANKINFDANAFSCAMQNILNFVIPEDDSWDLDSESDMSEYANENSKTTMQQYMDEMDRQLANTTIGESFLKKEECVVADEEDVENFKPVDIDMNALKNMLESYRSQMGEAGPSSNMLGPMGLHFDKNN